MAKLSVFATVGLAFSDTVRAARAMPVLVFAALIVSVAAVCTDVLFDIPATDTDPGGKPPLVSVGLGIAYEILLAPIFIAIYRLIILNDITSSYAPNLKSPRFRAFCGWAIAIFLLAEIPWSAARVFAPDNLRSALEPAALVWGLLIMLGLILLLPAVAVDAPGATPRNAIADVFGSFWRVVAIVLLTMLPLLVVAIAAVWGLPFVIEDTATIETVVFSLIGSFLTLVLTAAAARLYLVLANRLRSS